ncbi:hypothetical protein MRBLMC3_002927 [Sphingobium sp. LMC3-1-1.1]|uniref:hypothetical protein n=1 Tax=Sphingobium sp. LMC3-1-1.1 TaxID=3135241 RepID=UPI00341EBEE5
MKWFLSLLLAFALAAPTFAAEAPLVIQSGQIRKLPSATALQLSAPTTANSSINLPHGTAPVSPSNGDCWTTTAGLYCRISGATVGPYATGQAAIAADNIVGNFTGSSAVPTSQALPSCSTSGYALTYDTSTHAIGCSSIGLSAIAADSILANLSGSSAVPSAATLPSCSGSNDALYYDTTTHTIGCHAPSGSGGGTVTSIATSGLVTGGTITGSGTISLSSISAGYVVGNATGSSAVPTASTLSALIDQAIGGTQGQILYRGASSWSALSPGTSGQVLTTGGVGANPSWAAASGGLVLLEQHAASSSASLDFTASISGTYDEYLIELVNLVPANNAVTLYMRLSTDGGASYDSGANYGYTRWITNRFGSGSDGTDSGSNEIRINNNAVDNTATYGISGSARFFSPSSTSLHKIVSGSITLINAANIESGLFSGRYLSTTAVNAFRFLFSSGNISSGTIRVYGVAK